MRSRTRIDGREGASSTIFWWRAARAVALAEMQHVAMRVGEHLYLDMPRFDDRALEDEASVTGTLWRSDAALRTAAGSSSALSTRRMPRRHRPLPLDHDGKPMRAPLRPGALVWSSHRSRTRGMPAAAMRWRATRLVAIASMRDAGDRNTRRRIDRGGECRVSDRKP